MTPDPNLLDDPMIRRVAALRPEFPEADLDPHRPAARETLARATVSPAERSSRATARRAHRVRLPRVPPVPRVRGVRRVGALAITVAGVLAIALALSAALQGPVGTGSQPADAAVIVRHVERVLASRPGTIVVQRVDASVQEPNRPIERYSSYSVVESVPESTVQNLLQDQPPFGVSASIDGDEETYVPKTNTIYISNPYTPYIHPGPRRGTYVYRAGRGSPTPASPAFTSSLTLTRAEVRSLESGHAELLPHQLGDGHFALEIETLPREPTTEAEEIRSELRRHQLHFDGRVTLDGHSVYRFSEDRRNEQTTTSLYVDSATYAPVKIVTRTRVVGGTVDSTSVWTEYKVLPITAGSRRLLSLEALHPAARIDRNRADFLRAQRDLEHR